MGIYATGFGFKSIPVIALLPDGTREHVAYARNTREALHIIHYLNGGSDPAAAEVVSEYTGIPENQSAPILDAVKKLKPKKRRKQEDTEPDADDSAE